MNNSFDSFKKHLKLIIDIIKKKESIGLTIGLIVFTVIPFFFLHQPYEIFTLILSTYINGFGGIALWLTSGRSVLETTIVCTCVWNVFNILFYLGINLFELFFSKIKKWFSEKRQSSQKNKRLEEKLSSGIKSFSETIQNKEKSLRKKIISWLSGKSIFLAYFLWLIPFIPFLNLAIIIFAKRRRKKIDIWILLGLSFINVLLTVIAIQNGFHFGG